MFEIELCWDDLLVITKFKRNRTVAFAMNLHCASSQPSLDNADLIVRVDYCGNSRFHS